MAETTQIKLPDIGDFDAVEVIEIPIQPGDLVAVEDTLITLESDKATMDIPSPSSGVVQQVHVSVGDRVSEGVLIVTLTAETEAVTGAAETSGQQDSEPSASDSAGAQTGNRDGQRRQLLVLGGGPGGYTAAFRAADLGLDVTLVERYPTLGGVCLNVGCIPSKALLHVAKVITEVEEMQSHGLGMSLSGKPDAAALKEWKNRVIGKLTAGLAGMARQRGVQVVQGEGQFSGAHQMRVQTASGEQRIDFDSAIIAAGSRPARIPGFPEDPRIVDSTGALELDPIPERMLVIGGGIIGLEMATVYQALGSRITVVEMQDALIPGCDKDIVRPLHKRMSKRFEAILLQTSVTGIDAGDEHLTVHFEGDKAPASADFDAVLVAIGRRPNGDRIAAEQAGVAVDEHGYIRVDDQQRTHVPHLFAIGDITGQPMLAHKATAEAKIAAEVIAGHKRGFDDRIIPSVAYTDPEVAWAGVSEAEAKSQGLPYEKAVFPWAASGRSLSLGRDEGLTRALFNTETNRLIGIAMVGPNAGELIAEGVLAIEMGCDAEDIGLTIHPHPTLSETVAMAAEVYEGSITDLYVNDKKRK